MLMNTRRRALALLTAAAGLRLIPFPPHSLAKTPNCFAMQAVGQWKGVATQAQAGARISPLEDCVAFWGLSEEEVLAIAEQEHRF